MIPYYALVLIPYGIFLALSGRRKVSSALLRGVTLTVFFSILFCLLALRDETCGIDLARYALKYDEAANASWAEVWRSEKDTGYYLLQKLIRTCTADFGLFLAVIAFLALVGLWIFYVRESGHAPLTLVLFLTVAPFTMFFSGLRQILAMAWTVPAWCFARDNKLFRFLFAVAAASLFHMSGIVLLLLYPACRIRITPKWFYGLAPMMAAVLFLNKPIFRLFMQITGYDTYAMSDTGAYTVLILLVLFTVYVFVVPDESLLDKDTVALRNLLVLSVFLQCFAPVHTLAMRVNYYFLLFVPVLISRIPDRASRLWRPVARVSVWVMLLFFTGWFFLQAHMGADKLHVFPYVFRYA